MHQARGQGIDGDVDDLAKLISDGVREVDPFNLTSLVGVLHLKESD